MMNFKISVLLKIGFSILFSIIAFPAFAQPVPLCRKNAIQLQRERINAGDDITSFSITAIRYVGAQTSLRLSFSSAPFLQKQTIDYFPDSNNSYPKDRTELKKGYHVLLGYFLSIPVSEKLIFNLGSGPFYTSYKERDWGMLFWDGISDAGQVEGTTKTRTASYGLSFLNGFEYFFHKNFSLNFDLGISILKFSADENTLSKSSGTMDGEYYYYESIKKSTDRAFHISAKQSRFGLSFHF